MKNTLKLHEAIAIVLLNEVERTASFETIADVIERRNLFPNRKGTISLTEQIRIRTTISSSRYKHLFEFINPNKIKLK